MIMRGNIIKISIQLNMTTRGDPNNDLQCFVAKICCKSLIELFQGCFGIRILIPFHSDINNLDYFYHLGDVDCYGDDDDDPPKQRPGPH